MWNFTKLHFERVQKRHLGIIVGHFVRYHSCIHVYRDIDIDNYSEDTSRVCSSTMCYRHIKPLGIYIKAEENFFAHMLYICITFENPKFINIILLENVC